MDVSPEYVKMCEKAEDIQELWSISEGDWFVDTITFPQQRTLEILGGHPDWDDDFDQRHFKERQRRSFWLPRQDQLQEMVIPDDERDSSNRYVVLLDDFQDWVLNDCSGLDWSHKGCPSMEQLWLAFVMSERYGKVWNGENWIKQTVEVR